MAVASGEVGAGDPSTGDGLPPVMIPVLVIVPVGGSSEAPGNVTVGAMGDVGVGGISGGVSVGRIVGPKLEPTVGVGGRNSDSGNAGRIRLLT